MRQHDAWRGDGIVYDIAGPNGTTVSGTFCIAISSTPTFYVIYSVSMADATGGLNMDQGAIQIATNWGTSGWNPYSVVEVTPSNPISCSVPATAPAGAAMSCTPMPFGPILYVN
jgi:hypothetical protein